MSRAAIQHRRRGGSLEGERDSEKADQEEAQKTAHVDDCDGQAIDGQGGSMNLPTVARSSNLNYFRQFHG
jgi:hypothetical protein